MSVFLCPSDANITRGVSENNYRYNFGGSTPYQGARDWSNNTVHTGTDAQGLPVTGDGAFTITGSLKAKNFVDGMSKTAFFSERTSGSGKDLAAEGPTKSDFITSPMRETSWPFSSVDVHAQACGSYFGASNFHFNSAGRWLDGSDYSNGWATGTYSGTMYNHVRTPNWDGFDCGYASAILDVPGEHGIVTARSMHSGGVNVLMGDGGVAFVGDSIDLKLWQAAGTRAGSEPVDGL